MDNLRLLYTIIIVVLLALNIFLIAINIYLFFAVKRKNKDNDLAIKELLEARDAARRKKAHVSVYAYEENITKGRRAPKFNIVNVSSEEGYIFYRTYDVKHRGPSEKEFKKHIKDIIETKVAINS